MKELRPYQQNALDAITSRYAAGVRRQLLSAATGAGKSVIFAELVRRHVAEGRNCLILAHRDRLVTQGAGHIEAAIGARNVGLVNATAKNWWAPAVFATVQSAAGEKQLRRAPKFQTIIVDECHRGNSKSYRKVIDSLLQPGGLLLGVTATPNRTDKKGLIPAVFEELVFEIGMRQLIDEGYLCNVIGKEIRLPIDFSKIKTAISTDGIRDYRPEEVKAAFEEARWLERITEGWRLVASDRRTIVFVPPGVVDGRGCGMAHSLAEFMRLQGINAAAVDGTTDRREQDRVIRDFTEGRIQVLVNVNIFCLDDQTEILTTQGWRGIDDIREDDQVANWDNGKVYFEQPSRIIKRKRMPNERMVVLETKNRSIRVSENHRMVWKHLDWPNYHINEAKDLVGKARSLPVCGKAQPLPYQAEQEEKRTRAAHNRRVATLAHHYRKQGACLPSESLALAKRNIAERESLAYTQPQDLSIADCHFIGFWIGDGSRCQLRSGGVEYTAAQSMVYPNIIDWFDSVIGETGFDCVRKERHRQNIDYVQWSFGRGTGFGPQKRNGVYRIEPYLQKQGTDLFWSFNDDQFRALLVGFWYADGMHGKAESVPDSLTLCNNSYQLLSLLQAIASTRGYGTRITKGFNHQVNPAHQQNYKLLVYKGQSHAMTKFRLQFEDADWQDERLWCVTVRSGAILTRRRGTVTVMGNCEGLDIPPIDAVLFARPTQSSIIYSQAVGRGTRTFPGKADCLVIDVTGITEELAKEGQSLMTLGKVLPTEEQVEDQRKARFQAARDLIRRLWRKAITLAVEDGRVVVIGEIGAKDRARLDEYREEIAEILAERDGESIAAGGERKPINGSLLTSDQIEIRDIDFTRAGMRFDWVIDREAKEAHILKDDQYHIIRRKAGAASRPTALASFEYKVFFNQKNLIDSAYYAARPDMHFYEWDEAKAAVERHIAQIELQKQHVFNNPNAPWRLKPASEKQKTMLRKFKVPFGDDITAGEASDTIDRLFKRKRA